MGAFAAALGGLLLLSYAALGASWEFVTGCYGTLILLSDLTPTIGLFQPVFVALFDRYRALFLLLVHGHCVGYLVPLGLRFRCGSPPAPYHHTHTSRAHTAQVRPSRLEDSDNGRRVGSGASRCTWRRCCCC